MYIQTKKLIARRIRKQSGCMNRSYYIDNFITPNRIDFSKKYHLKIPFGYPNPNSNQYHFYDVNEGTEVKVFDQSVPIGEKHDLTVNLYDNEEADISPDETIRHMTLFEMIDDGELKIITSNKDIEKLFM